jgi:hypothetical protein
MRLKRTAQLAMENPLALLLTLLAGAFTQAKT